MCKQDYESLKAAQVVPQELAAVEPDQPTQPEAASPAPPKRQPRLRRVMYLVAAGVAVVMLLWVGLSTSRNAAIQASLNTPLFHIGGRVELVVDTEYKIYWEERSYSRLIDWRTDEREEVIIPAKLEVPTTNSYGELLEMVLCYYANDDVGLANMCRTRYRTTSSGNPYASRQIETYAPLTPALVLGVYEYDIPGIISPFKRFAYEVRIDGIGGTKWVCEENLIPASL